MNKWGFILTIISGGILILTCSNARQDYQKVNLLQESTSQQLQSIGDYDEAIKACDNVIVSLEDYLNNHKEGEWSNLARTALSNWQDRKSIFQKKYDSLKDRLVNALQDKAIKVAKSQHPLSNIDSLKLEDRQIQKDRFIITYKDFYDIRMRGSILGRSIFKLKIIVWGQMDMSQNSIYVSDDAKMEE